MSKVELAKPPKIPKAVHILHLEQAANKLNLLNLPSFRESSQTQRYSRLSLIKRPPLKQRLSVGDQASCSRSSYLQSNSNQRKNRSDSMNSCILEQKINKLRREIDKVKKLQKGEHNKPILQAITKIGEMKRLHFFNNIKERCMSITSRQDVYKNINYNKEQIKDLPEIECKTIQQNDKNIFIRNLLLNDEPKIIKPKLTVPVKKSAPRSCSQGTITLIRNAAHQQWPSEIHEFSGWDIDHEWDSKMV